MGGVRGVLVSYFALRCLFHMSLIPMALAFLQRYNNHNSFFAILGLNKFPPRGAISSFQMTKDNRYETI